MNFVTMGDTKYFQTILLSVKKSARYYPERKLFLYDWGLEPSQLEQLTGFSGVEIINWRDRLINADLVFPEQRTFKAFIKKQILRHPNLRIPQGQWQREFLLDEKCYCMIDTMSRTEASFLFLDGDAFIVNHVDDLADEDSDVVVTLRSLEEIEAAMKRGSRHDINSGVIFFNKNKIKTVAFIIEWIKEMNMLNLKRHPLSEQTGLSNLILRDDANAFVEPKKNVDILIGDLSIRCKIVSTHSYNYNFVEDGFDPDVNRILHLKSGRGFDGTLEKVKASLWSK
jgi:hypothetical protein